jgi:hypothetical protein
LVGDFRRRYGAGPLHLVGHVVVLAVAAFAAFAIYRIAGGGSLVKLVALYIGFVIAHDLIFLPAYSALDRVVRAALARLPGPPSGTVPAINHIRAPAFISGLLLIIYLPLISGRADPGYFGASGHHLVGYLRNWVLISAALFVGSALIYVVRLRRTVIKGRT